MTTVDELLAGLAGAKDWNKQFGQVRRWAASGQVERAVEAGEALADARRSACIAPWVRESMRESLESTLAQTPGVASAEAALRVSLLPPGEGRFRLGGPGRQVAAHLAGAQTPETLDALFAQCGPDAHYRGALACLAQEMLLRGRPIADTPAGAFWTALPADHPLAWLPPALLPCEEGLRAWLPRYGPQGESWGSPMAEGIPVPPAPARTWTAHAVEDAGARRIPAAVANWAAASNGRFEARVFASHRPLTADAITATPLSTFGMDCLGGAKAAGITLARIPFANALALLFGAAANGGAYNSGRGGAYGRRDAWQSAAGLVGAGDDDTPAQVLALAARAAWFSFDADSGWFDHVAWDLGLLALRPDGRTLALLAATDTD